MIHRDRQFITLFAALVISLVQFGALLHATEHPFHQENALCLSLQSAEQDKHFFYAVPASLNNDVLISDVATPLPENIFPSLNSHYSSRAPPVATV